MAARFVGMVKKDRSDKRIRPGISLLIEYGFSKAPRLRNPPCENKLVLL